MRSRPLALASAAAFGAVIALAGCPAAGREPAPLTPIWQEVALPGADGRFALGDVASCAGRWYVLGAAVAADGATRPAAWSSVDSRGWTVVAIGPVSAYGPLHRFYSAACGSGRLVVIGAAPGGAHGNNRTNTWLATRAGGPLVEVAAPFEQYGGDRAGSVNRVTGADNGFLIAGNRIDANGSAGAAVWSSPDGAAFTLQDADPALESDAAGQTSASEAAPAGSDGWVLVGSLLPPGRPDAARDPLAWVSPDGAHWHREPVPSSSTVDESMDRVTAWHGATLAAGVRGTSFGAWLRTGTASAGSWRAGGRFDTIAGSAVPLVTGITTDGSTAFVAVCNGTAYRLWATADGIAWRPVNVPVSMPAGAQRRLLLAAAGDRLLLAADDGQRVRLWTAGSPKLR